MGIDYVVDAVFGLLRWVFGIARRNPRLTIGMAIGWWLIFNAITQWREIKLGSPRQRAGVFAAAILVALVASAGFWQTAGRFQRLASILVAAITALIYCAIRLDGRFPSRKAWREMKEAERLQLAYREGVRRSQGSDAIVGMPKKMGNGRIDVKVRTPKSVSELAEAASVGSLGANMNIASAMHGIADADQVKLATVTRNPGDPEGTATVVTITEEDPLIGRRFYAPPIAGLTDANGRKWGTPIKIGDPTTLGVPAEVGVNIMEEPIKVETFENLIFIGGLTGSGKSMMLTGLIRAFACRPHTALVLGDGAGKADCFSWGPRASSIAIGDRAVHQQGLWVINEVKRRFGTLMDFNAARQGNWGDGKRKVILGPDMPHIVVFWDEFGEVFKTGNFENEFHSIMTLSRAAGVTIILATQRPDYTTIPTRIRDAVPSAIGFATRDNNHSGMVFGSGKVPAHDRSKIGVGPQWRGIGYVMHEDSPVPTRFKSFFVDDHEIPQTAKATAHLRVELEGLGHLIENLSLKNENEDDW